MDAQRTLNGQGLHAIQADGAAPAVLVDGRSPGDLGVAVAALRFAGGAHLAGHCGEHLISFHMSAPSMLRCAIAGRRLEHRAVAGSLSICPANADCGVEAPDDIDAVSLVLSSECFAMEALRADIAEPRLVERLHGRDAPLLRLARLLLAETAAGLPNGPLFWSSVSDQIFRHVATHHVAAPLVPVHGALSRRALNMLSDYVHAHIGEPIGVAELAAVAGCSRFHFSRLFRHATGMTPHRYVMRLRVTHAVDLLRGSAQPLSEVAAATGFTDQSHLSRWMRQVHGMAPGELRRGN